jgi:DUF1365 family protein
MHSSIFSGQVSHWRKLPVGHAFRYRVFMMYLDLGELDEVFAGRWLWSTSRPAFARFRRSKYFGDPGESLDTSVRELVLDKTGVRPSGPIRLLTNLSYFGYCFNPLSVYYCFDDEDERVETIVAEVSNTPWGERCCYVLSSSQDTGDEKTHRYKIDKSLHVSPFMEMNITYDWLVTEPEEDLVVRIDNWSGDSRLFGASLNLKRKEITGSTLAGVLTRFPFMTLKIIAAIHWQAFRLWLKGCPLVAHPDKNAPVGVNR